MSLFVVGCCDLCDEETVQETNNELTGNAVVVGEGENIENNFLEGFSALQFCEIDNDCVYQSDGCCGLAVNKENYIEDYVQKVGDATGYYPHCYTQCNIFKKAYCSGNDCKLKTDCSDCSAIKEFMERQHCFDDYVPAQVKTACRQLTECGC